MIYAAVIVGVLFYYAGICGTAYVAARLMKDDKIGGPPLAFLMGLFWPLAWAVGPLIWFMYRGARGGKW